jgi:hypothetical protein
MEDKLIDFKTAVLAKEKGFNWETLYCYLENGELQYSSGDDGDHDGYNHNKWDNISAPTQSLLQAWLREKYNIHIELQFSRNSTDDGLEWWFYLYPNINIGGRVKFFPYEIGENLTFNAALEQGLLKALKFIK